MQSKNSTSLISGTAVLSFALIGCSLYLLNFSLATEVMWFMLPVGSLGLAIGLIVLIHNRLHPDEELRRPKQLLPLLVLLASLAVLVSGFLWFVMPSIFTLGVPVLILLTQAATCEFLLRAKVSKISSILLIASVILEFATWWAADRIGTENGADRVRILTHPLILSWFACVTAATFSIREVSIAGSGEPNQRIGSARKFATVLWAGSAIIWMIALVLIIRSSEASIP